MEDNVEIVRRMTGAMQDFWRGSSWEETLEPFFDAEVDYYPVRKFPDNRPRHGADELARFLAGYNEAWQVSDWEILDVTAVGDDRVLMRVRLIGAGRGSGLELAGDVYFCYWLRGGRIFRQEDHLTEAGARRALGLA